MIPNTQTSLVAQFLLTVDDEPSRDELHRVVAWDNEGQPLICTDVNYRLTTPEQHASWASTDYCGVTYCGVYDLQQPQPERHPRPNDDEGQVFSDGAARFI